MKRHISQVLSGKMPDAESLSDLVEHVERRVAMMASRDRDFVQKRDRILARGDTDRAKRFVLAKITQLLPEAAKRELRLFNAPGTKPAPAQTTDQSQRTTSTPAGVARIMKQPQSSEINWRRTTSEMVMKGEAHLKDGKHVKWE